MTDDYGPWPGLAEYYSGQQRTVITRDTREGRPLLTVSTVVNGDSKEFK
jgi:hypothetical protein